MFTYIMKKMKEYGLKKILCRNMHFSSEERNSGLTRLRLIKDFGKTMAMREMAIIKKNNRNKLIRYLSLRQMLTFTNSVKFKNLDLKFRFGHTTDIDVILTSKKKDKHLGIIY